MRLGARHGWLCPRAGSWGGRLHSPGTEWQDCCVAANQGALHNGEPSPLRRFPPALGLSATPWEILCSLPRPCQVPSSHSSLPQPAPQQPSQRPSHGRRAAAAGAAQPCPQGRRLAPGAWASPQRRSGRLIRRGAAAQKSALPPVMARLALPPPLLVAFCSAATSLALDAACCRVRLDTGIPFSLAAKAHTAARRRPKTNWPRCRTARRRQRAQSGVGRAITAALPASADQ